MTRAGSRIFGPGPETSRTLVSLEPETGERQFCVTRLVNIPIFSRGSSADKILTQTTQPARITDLTSLADLYIVMDPQPFPRRFLGNIRSMTRITCDQGTQNENVAGALHEILPNTRFASRDPTAIDSSRLVPGFGNRE